MRQAASTLYKRLEPPHDDPREELPYPDWGDQFLNILRQTGNVRLSAGGSGVARTTVIRYLHGDNDKHPPPNTTPKKANAEFILGYNAALDEALDVLRQEAYRRAMQGSDAMLKFLLQAGDPETYAPQRAAIANAAEDIAGEQIKAIRASVMQKLLARMEPAQLEAPVDASVRELGPGE